MLSRLSVLALAATAAQAACPSKPSLCCGALSKNPQLKDKIVYPDTTLYTDRLESYWSSSAALEPWCMAMPTTTEEVSAAVKVFNEHQCPFGIRSGGHSQWAGASSIHQGVTVDLGYFNSTTYDQEKNIVSIHPGSRWQEVYDTLEPYNASVPGGRAGIVGVGGFITGGGYSYYFYDRGFAADNVINFEVVLGDGSIVNANAHENTDLWHGLKGSSGNLALVTRFDMEGVKWNTLWGGLTTYAMEYADDLWTAFVNFLDRVDDNTHTQAIAYTYYIDGKFGLQSLLSDNQNNPKAETLDEFRSIPTTSTTLRQTTVSNLSAELSGGQPIGVHADWFVTQFKTDKRIMDFVTKRHQEIVPEMKKKISADAELQTLCQFQPVVPSAVNAANEMGGNVMGLNNIIVDGKASTMFLFTVQVSTAEDESTVIAYAQEFISEIEAYAESLGEHFPWKFLNYSFKTQDPIGMYGVEALSAIKAAAAKYDPTAVFQRLRQTGFKIPA